LTEKIIEVLKWLYFKKQKLLIWIKHNFYFEENIENDMLKWMFNDLCKNQQQNNNLKYFHIKLLILGIHTVIILI